MRAVRGTLAVALENPAAAVAGSRPRAAEVHQGAGQADPGGRQADPGVGHQGRLHLKVCNRQRQAANLYQDFYCIGC